LRGDAVRRFAGDWAAVAAPLLGQQLRRSLHLGAAALAGRLKTAIGRVLRAVLDDIYRDSPAGDAGTEPDLRG